MSNMAIAQTIQEQMGGRRLAIMTGAKQFMAVENGLSFRLPGRPGYAKQNINYVKVTLNGMDLYDIEFGRIWGTKYKTLAVKNNIYTDQLLEVFRNETGLETKAPRVFAN